MTRRSTICGELAALFSVLTIGFAQPAAAGGLSFVEFHAASNMVNEGIRNAERMVVSPDGENVYTASVAEDSVGVWTRNLTTGELTFLEIEEDGVGGVDGIDKPVTVAVSPDGNCVYAAGEQEGKVAVFSRSGINGALTFVEVKEEGVGGVVGMDRPAALVVSPDDLHVYVTGRDGPPGAVGTVVAFSRTPPACALTYVETETGDGTGLGKEGGQLAISADGAHLYVGGTILANEENRGAVNVLSRNAVTGVLTFVEREYDGNNGVVDLANRVRAITVSPDGTSVYATSGEDDSVVVFSRNAGTGDITFVESQRDGGGVNDGLKVPTALAVSPDNTYLFVVANGDESVAVYRRDTTTGGLRFLEVQKDPLIDPPNEVIQGAHGMALSPNGASLYAGNRGLTVFDVDICGNGNVGSDEHCDDGNLVGGDGCSASCRLELCGPVPSAGCRGTAPLAAALKVKNLSPDKKDQMQWKWNKGDATTFADFGDPTTTTSFVICIYDSSANPQPLSVNAAPADGTCKKGKPCWKVSTGAYKYNDGLLTPDGLQVGQMKEGLVNGTAKMQFKGKSINLVPPALPLTLPVTVQVKDTANGICWESVHTAADLNDTSQFKSKGD